MADLEEIGSYGFVVLLIDNMKCKRKCIFFAFAAQDIFKVQHFNIHDLKSLLEEEQYHVYDGRLCHFTVRALIYVKNSYQSEEPVKACFCCIHTSYFTIYVLFIVSKLSWTLIDFHIM